MRRQFCARQRAGIGFRKHDNAFLAVDDVAALQASADRLRSGDSGEFMHAALERPNVPATWN